MKYILLVVCVILLIGLVSADLRVVLKTPQVTFKNVTGSPFEYYIGVENKNNFTLDIQISPRDLNLTFDGPLDFSLEPQESKNIPYKGIIPSPGNYTKQIGIKYSGNNETLSLVSSLIFRATEKPEEPSSNSSLGSDSQNSDSKPKTIQSASDTNLSENTNPENTSKTEEIDSDLKSTNYLYWYLLLIIVIAVVLILVFVLIKKSRKNEVQNVQ